MVTLRGCFSRIGSAHRLSSSLISQRGSRLAFVGIHVANTFLQMNRTCSHTLEQYLKATAEQCNVLKFKKGFTHNTFICQSSQCLQVLEKYNNEESFLLHFTTNHNAHKPVHQTCTRQRFCSSARYIPIRSRFVFMPCLPTSELFLSSSRSTATSAYSRSWPRPLPQVQVATAG